MRSKRASRAKRLLIHFLVPGRAGRPDQQERIEEGVVDGALQRVGLVQALLFAVAVDFPGGRRSFCSVISAAGLHLQVWPSILISLA